MVTARALGDSGTQITSTTDRKQVAVMDQLTQLAGDVHRQRLAYAKQRRPVQRLLVLHRATGRAERAERAGRRMSRAERQARRLRAQIGA
jgi:hypothetical protein